MIPDVAHGWYAAGWAIDSWMSWWLDSSAISAIIPASDSRLSDIILTPHPNCCSGMKLARSQGGRVRQNWTEPADNSAQNKIATLSVSPKLLTSEALEPQHARTVCFWWNLPVALFCWTGWFPEISTSPFKPRMSFTCLYFHWTSSAKVHRCQKTAKYLEWNCLGTGSEKKKGHHELSLLPSLLITWPTSLLSPSSSVKQLTCCYGLLQSPEPQQTISTSLCVRQVMYVRTYVHTYARTYACMHACMHGCNVM